MYTCNGRRAYTTNKIVDKRERLQHKYTYGVSSFVMLQYVVRRCNSSGKVGVREVYLP